MAVAGSDAGGHLATAIHRQGARVALLTDRDVRTDAGVCRISTTFSSRKDVSSALGYVQHQLGRAQLIIHSSIARAALASAPIETITDDQWNEATHETLKRTVYCLQAAHEHFAGGGGAIVMFGPALSLVGAAGLVPLSMALEGQRALMKSAARQWGPQGIRVNWLALGESGNYPELASALLPGAPDFSQTGAPLGRVPCLDSDVAAVATLLVSRAARSLTGATINIDGGNWMVP